jgi:N-acetylmuramoyl-L-alanine amidase
VIVHPAPDEAPPVTRARVLSHQGLSRPQATPAPDAPHPHVIVLDPGHGRGDPGAVHHGPDGRVDLTEAAVNESIATLMKGFLDEKGYDVYVTREGWGRAPAALTQTIIWTDLFSRVALAHAVDAEAFISIHANGSPRPEHRGVEMWYCGNHAYAAENAYLAQLLLDAALQGLRDYGYIALNRGIQEDTDAHHSEGFGCLFLVTREARMPAVLTEILFLTNDEDAAVLRDERSREAVARSMAEAIHTFFETRDDLFPPP